MGAEIEDLQLFREIAGFLAGIRGILLQLQSGRISASVDFIDHGLAAFLCAHTRSETRLRFPVRDFRFLAKTHYAESRALVIGIDKYQKASPLGFAVSDAVAVRDALVEDLGFPSKNVISLLNHEATGENIRRAFLSFASETIALDDRILIFFAGHGTTKAGIRGETGYLVPVDADPSDLSTLIRWDELTRNSDLIRAKHMLFVMDACYGGLALTRAPQAGSARFLKDMMLRYSRQVLTAGKADETVADSGGPLPGHSVFTGHFLEGLKGNAATVDGTITANGLMSYVYAKVSSDKNSSQTPHFGYFDGDGDFILIAPKLSELENSTEKDFDRLMIVPFVADEVPISSVASKVLRVKELLGKDDSSIQLHDLITVEVKRFLSLSGDDNFRSQASFSYEELLLRIENYENVTNELSVLLACIAHWARPAHRQVLGKALARSTDRLGVESGLIIWINLRWYPLIIQFYSAGIAAIEGKRYDSLADLFLTYVDSERRQKQQHFADALSAAVLELTRMEVFKRLPGHEQQYTPMSEYLFKLLQPRLDDALFIGKNYENDFDEFEMLFALVTADLGRERGESLWGPVGRFGWKSRRMDRSPLSELIKNALAKGNDWPPIQNGLFGGDISRFKKVAEEYQIIIYGLNWH